MRRSQLIAGGGLALAIGMFTTHGTTASKWTPQVREVASPAGPGSAQPQLTVRDDRVLLSWVQQDSDRASLKLSSLSGDAWTEARSVSGGTDFFVNWADVPSVVRLADGSLAAHWLQKSAATPYAYDVRLSLSGDDGATWSQPTSPHHDGTHTEHGFASLFQAPGANGLGLVWLDGRAMKPMTSTDHEGLDAGSMGIRAAEFDRTGRQISETLIDDRVCECCPTAAALTAEGPIVAFRNRSPEEIRDIYVSRLVNGKWSEPAPVHRDNWKIAACPVNGPALGADGQTVVVAWFTGVGGEGHVYAAFSSDAGQTFAEPIRIDDAVALGRVDVELLPDRSAVVSWIEFADRRAEFRIRRVETSGIRSESVAVASISGNRASGYPRMARRGAHLIFAWTDTNTGLRVRTAIADLPVAGTRETPGR